MSSSYNLPTLDILLNNSAARDDFIRQLTQVKPVITSTDIGIAISFLILWVFLFRSYATGVGKVVLGVFAVIQLVKVVQMAKIYFANKPTN